MAKICCNDIIRDSIKKGLRLENGTIILPSGKAASLGTHEKGYRTITLGPENRRRVFTVGRIVCWLTHGEPPSESHETDHINQNKRDDRPENLRWATISENLNNVSGAAAERRRMVTILNPRKRYHGEDHPSAKLNNLAVQEIRSERRSPSHYALAFGVRVSTIRAIQRREKWTHI